MKEIKAYIRPERIDMTLTALKEAGIAGMTVIHVQAIGEACDPHQLKVSAELARGYMQVAKLEIICRATEVDRYVELIIEKGHTGEKGDGMIFVADVEEAVSIRSGRRGIDSL